MSNPLPQTLRTALAAAFELLPPKARTAIYATAVGVALLAWAAQRVVAVWWPELDARVDATAADVVSAALFVVGVMGFAYRPTRTDQMLPLAEPVDEPVYTQEVLARTIATLTAAGYGHAVAVDAVTAGDLTILTRTDPV